MVAAAVEVALDLGEPVVRRHVANSSMRLAGSWTVDLGRGIRGLAHAHRDPVRRSRRPAPGQGAAGDDNDQPQRARGMVWARLEHRGRAWKSAREPPWTQSAGQSPLGASRGYAPSLLTSSAGSRLSPPGRGDCGAGGRREDRKNDPRTLARRRLVRQVRRMRYDCAGASVAHWMAWLAEKIDCGAHDSPRVMQPTAEEIAALTDAEAERPSGDESRLPSDEVPAISARTTRHGIPYRLPQRHPNWTFRRTMSAPVAETAEPVAEHDRRYREIFGINDEQPKRRWRRAKLSCATRFRSELESIGSQSELRSHVVPARQRQRELRACPSRAVLGGNVGYLSRDERRSSATGGPDDAGSSAECRHCQSGPVVGR